jgi:N-methylhydantoinase A
VLLDVRDQRALAGAVRQLEREVLATFSAAERRHVRLERRAEVRTRGQAHELTVEAWPLPALAGRFHAAHERRYGFADRDAEVEVVTLEVGGWLPAALPRERRAARERGAGGRAERVAAFVAGRAVRVPLWRRAQLPPGATFRGPAVVVDDGATLWVAPGWRARLHASGAVVLTPGGGTR